MISTILAVAAAVFLALAAWGVHDAPSDKPNFVWLGLALWALAYAGLDAYRNRPRT